MTNIYLILMCICLLEGNPSGRPTDHGQGKSELSIHAAAVSDYNRWTGLRVAHADVSDSDVAYDVARAYIEHYAGGKTVREIGQIWNQGASAVRDHRGIEYGRRLANLVEDWE